MPGGITNSGRADDDVVPKMQPSTQKKDPRFLGGQSTEFPGDVLLSHAVTREVPSGLKGLTAVFGMGTGVAPSLRSPGKLVSL